MVFDTLEYLETLKASGVTEEQSKAQVRALAKALESQDVATKSDLLQLKGMFKSDISDLKTELKTDISDLKTELKTDISDLKTELKTDNLELKVELIKWMIGMGISIVSIMFVLLRFMLPS